MNLTNFRLTEAYLKKHAQKMYECAVAYSMFNNCSMSQAQTELWGEIYFECED